MLFSTGICDTGVAIPYVRHRGTFAAHTPDGASPTIGV